MSHPGDEYEKMVKEIFDRDRKGLINYAYRLVRDWPEAEDFVTEAYLQVFEAPAACPTEEQVKPFLYTKVRSLCLNALIRRTRQTAWEKEYQHRLELEHDPAHQEITEGLLARIKEEIRKMPPQRQTIIALLNKGHKPKEVAEQLGITEQTVRNTKKTALDKLRELLRQKGVFFLLVLFLAGGPVSIFFQPMVEKRLTLV
jgi:RNA polymerase sigma factor (sigma-70 family)